MTKVIFMLLCCIVTTYSGSSEILFDTSDTFEPWLNYDCGDNVYFKSRTGVKVKNNVECFLDPLYLTFLNVGSDPLPKPNIYASYGVSERDTCKNFMVCEARQQLSMKNCLESMFMKVYDFTADQIFETMVVPKISLVYSLDPHCTYEYRHETGKQITRFHRWRTPDYLSIYQNLSLGDLQVHSDGKDLFIKTEAIEDPKTNPHKRVELQEKFEFVTDSFDQEVAKSYKFDKLKPCNSLCDYGQMITYNVSADSIFHFKLHVKKSCDWVAFCSVHTRTRSGRYCEKSDTTILSLRNDVVFFSSSPIAIPLKMQTGKFGNDFSLIELTKLESGMIAITNSLRQRAINRHVENRNSESLTFLFPQSDCLKENLGIETNVSNGRVYIQVSEDPKKIKASPTLAKLAEVTKAKKVVIKTTTADPLSLTVAPTKALNMYAGNEVAVSLKLAYHGWSAWAIFFGFLTGTITGGLGLAGSLYMLRRSMYTSWYRGMHKFYGRDSSMESTVGVTVAESIVQSSMGSIASAVSTVGSDMSNVASTVLPTQSLNLATPSSKKRKY